MEGPDQHDDVEGEIVPDHVADDQFHGDGEQHHNEARNGARVGFFGARLAGSRTRPKRPSGTWSSLGLHRRRREVARDEADDRAAPAAMGAKAITSRTPQGAN